MSKFFIRVKDFLTFFLILLTLSACGEREDTRTHEEIIRADLAEILALQGSPCGEVISYRVNERMRYRLKCENGEIYRVRVSPAGQVKVNKHDRENRSP